MPLILLAQIVTAPVAPATESPVVEAPVVEAPVVDAPAAPPRPEVVVRPPPRDMPVPEPSRSGLSGATVAIGGFYRAIYAVPSYGGIASFSLGFGGRAYDPAWPTLHMGLNIERGTTPQALAVTAGQVCFYPEWTLGPLHLGMEWRIGGQSIEAVTARPALLAMTMGVAAHVGVDIVRLDTTKALYVVATGANDSFLWSANFALGYRWDAIPRGR